MTAHDLDRPALSALRTHHSVHAQSGGKAIRYDPDVAPFISLFEETAEALADAGRFVPKDRLAIMLQRERSPLPPGTSAEFQAEGVQMVAQHCRLSRTPTSLRCPKRTRRRWLNWRPSRSPAPFSSAPMSLAATSASAIRAALWPWRESASSCRVYGSQCRLHASRLPGQGLCRGVDACCRHPHRGAWRDALPSYLRRQHQRDPPL